MIYPAVVCGSHMSAVPNHQTENITPPKFRFDIAASGHLSMEFLPARMFEKEKTFARRAIASYKQYRDLVFSGDLYRIVSPYDSDVFYALMYVSKNLKCVVIFAYCICYQSRTLVPRF